MVHVSVSAQHLILLNRSDSIQKKCNYVENNLVLLRGLPFIPYIDALDTLKRHVDGPFMMPIVDKYSEMGTVLIGKVGL